jgi:hypothetical protein
MYIFYNLYGYLLLVEKRLFITIGKDLGYFVKEVIETCEKVTGRKAVMNTLTVARATQRALWQNLRRTWWESGIFVGTNDRKRVEVVSAKRIRKTGTLIWEGGLFIF